MIIEEEFVRWKKRSGSFSGFLFPSFTCLSIITCTNQAINVTNNYQKSKFLKTV